MPVHIKQVSLVFFIDQYSYLLYFFFMKNNTLRKKDKNPLDALYRAIKLAGGQSALAKCCGVKQQTVYIWIKTGRLPAERVLQVEKAVGVSRHDLRPDIYPRSE